MGDEEIINFYKKRIEPFVAIFILAMLIVLGVMLYQDHQLKKEINHNCGWQDKEYECYCQKSVVEKIKLEMPGNNGVLNLQNVSLAG